MNHVVIFLTGAVPFPEGSMKHSWYIQHGPLIEFKLAQGWGVQFISVGPSLVVEGRCETITFTKMKTNLTFRAAGLATVGCHLELQAQCNIQVAEWQNTDGP